MRLAAVDLGADSGRVVIGDFDGRRLTVEDVHRFPNRPVERHETIFWDIHQVYAEVIEGIRAAGRVVSIGIDSWGVDYGLLAPDGRLLGLPVHYRDQRTEGMLEEAFRRVPRSEIYTQTGIQFMRINTLYQLLAMVLARDPQLDFADRLLMIPALISFWLTGARADEYTNATTTQCFDPQAGTWSRDLLDRLGIPGRLFGDVVQPGTQLGAPRPALELAAEQVIAVATHDTASAVAAVPFESPREAAYISSGTWSLVGVETDRPVISEDALAANLTNEGGVAGTFRVLKNVMGLWLFQECRRAWAAQGSDLTYDDLLQQAAASPPFAAVIDPDHESLLSPGDMPARIVKLAAESGQTLALEPGPITRCILESLALKYRSTVTQLEQVTGTKIRAIHVLGGGANNALLCQMTADSCARPVVAGPSEASAVGNLLIQAMALGLVATLTEGRELVKNSFQPLTYEPRVANEWSALGTPA